MTLLLLEGGEGFATRSGFGLLLDPDTDGELDIADGEAYRTISIDAPDPDLKSVWASSIDTEGADAAGGHGYENREVTVKLRAYGASPDDLLDKLSAIERKVGKLNREKGALRLVYPSSNYVDFDVVAARSMPALGQSFLTAYRTEVEVKLTCRPFYREAEEGVLTDDFSSDSISDGLWAFDAGFGTAAVAGGHLTFSDTTTKQLYRTDRLFYDGQVTVAYRTASSGIPVAGPIAKRLGASDFLYASIAGGFNTFSLVKSDGGSETTLATTAFTPAASTTYWIRLRAEGNKLTAEVWDLTGILLWAVHDPAGVPLKSLTHTLSGANAAKFGIGVAGRAGIRATPGATTAYADSFEVIPNYYVEKTDRVLRTQPIFGVRGDVPALVRAEVDDLQQVDHDTVIFGAHSRFLDPSPATNTLSSPFLAATLLTPLGGTTNMTLALVNSDLSPFWQAMMKSDIPGLGVPVNHRGNYRVFARLQRPATNAGEVSVALEWGSGDLSRFTVNDAVTFPVGDREGVGTVVDLGVVSIPADSLRWEFRLLGRSTVAGDEVQMIDFAFLPTELGYGKVMASRRTQAPDVFTSRDEFDQGGTSNLNGLTAPVGGNWATSGAAGDFALASAGGGGGNPPFLYPWVQRIAASDADADSGRYAILGASAVAAQAVECVFNVTARPTGDEVIRAGVLVRYVDASNWLMVGWDVTANGSNVQDSFFVRKRVAGALTDLVLVPFVFPVISIPFVMRVMVDAAGRWSVWSFVFGSAPGTPNYIGADAALATGGPLDDGKPGFYDANTDAGIITRAVDSFAAWVPVTDAALFASRSLELRSDGASRYNADGSILQSIPVRGSHPYAAAAGLEGRASQLVVMPLRNDVDTGPNGETDDLAVTVLVTPRGRIVPQAA